MGASRFVESLRSFDSHERGLLLQWAADRPFQLGAALGSAVSQAIGTQPPKDAFVAMDYTLDWLYAAVHGALDDNRVQPHPWPAHGELAASQEDVDLLIAWEDLRGPHLVLIEAKGFTGWSNAQMKRKTTRLGAIFTEELRDQVDVHLFLAGPAPAKGLNVDDWPDWTRPGAHTHFLSISDPGMRFAVQRCDEEGLPTSRDWTHWSAVPRRWQAAPSVMSEGDLVARPEPAAMRERPCSRCGASAEWLVTARYDESQVAGRLLVYCASCRRDMSGSLGTVLPITILDDNPDAVLTLLYRHKATGSDPATAAQVIGVQAGPWIEVARKHLEVHDVQ